MTWKIVITLFLFALFPIILLQMDMGKEAIAPEQVPANSSHIDAPRYWSEPQSRFLIFEPDPAGIVEPLLVQEEGQQVYPGEEVEQPQEPANQQERVGYYWWWWIIIGGIIIFFIIVFAAWGGWGGRGTRGGPPPEDRL
ncbi:MAG: hypothetical protein C4520_01720 [Candidatus Abyssobacteria bacterium SURF_5]|uniref:Uncharacterized protein n=1 Tax=Abyssobacteria bacterium (strain SURF_5) TaxID=2093360 RepID=A0A3A4NZI6_ABYX5|nr:MAG: hypothetical protein C4520_01720 [Candidatus Abyssubacteria bacterium SURF_5]